MHKIDEIAPDVFRISVWVPEFGLEFNHFVVRDEEPLLFHTGYNRMFSELKEAVGRVIEPSKLRWVGFSHFESDECGSLNHWLEIAPQAKPVCTFLAAQLSVNDFAIREAVGMQDGEPLQTGKYRFQFLSTAHMPHGWDAGVLFEETQRTLFCSDLLFQFGARAPLTQSDILEPVRESLLNMQKSPFAYSVPYTPQTKQILEKLAAVQPRTLATMHGSSFNGDCKAALRGYGEIVKEVLGGPFE